MCSYLVMRTLVLLCCALAFSETYEIGVDYHAIASNFTESVFLTGYHLPIVRSVVLDQLQGMADSGATFVSLRIWFVAQPGAVVNPNWQATFPMSDQEMANLHQYAQDVSQIQSTKDGHGLHLDVGLLWLGAADYTIGSPADGLGYFHLSASEFTSRVEKSIQNVLQAVSNIKHRYGSPLVQTIYLEGEVMIGAKANQDWFLLSHYPRFLQLVSAAGFTPSIYFLVEALEDYILQADYIDAEFPALNGHRSMYWIYRSLHFLNSRQLPLPTRIDFSCYIDRHTATYANLTKHIFDDASAALSVLGAPDRYGVAETYYFVNATQRRDYGQAFASEALSRPGIDRLSFWTTPDAGGKGVHVGYPFSIGDFLPSSTF